MTWTYDASLLTNPEDKNYNLTIVRFKVGDTDKDYSFLQDEEIQYLLGINDNSIMATSIAACRSIIATLAKQVNYKIGPEYVDASDRIRHYKDLLKELLAESKGMGFPNMDGTDFRPAIFEIGMDDNHNVGYYPSLERE